MNTTATLLRAVTASQYAPSPRGTRPWRWELHDGVAELWAVRDQQLTALDPEGQLRILGCGAALHHARVALAADGHTTATTRTPDPDRPDLLAELRVTGARAVRAPDLRRYRSMLTRHIDRPAVPSQAVPDAALDSLQWAAERYETHLRILEPDEATRLTHGDVEPCVAPTGDRYAVLVTDADTPLDWLTAGEALGEILLTAVAAGLTVTPETRCGTRDEVRGVLAERGWPILTLCLGVADRTAAAWTARTEFGAAAPAGDFEQTLMSVT
ncbi:hypothetical protein R8Z50_21860 [Longispora sp. K20-0274]|uniref:hypothetical protein n=1 Tax=Longispora sp. K20-0274 TaxID=3088255 RepID=UPI003999C458